MSLKRNRNRSPIHANGGPGDKKKNTTIPGQSITESGHVAAEDEPLESTHESGPVEGDLIRGKHLEYSDDGYVVDNDYEIKFQKDTSDVHGPYKIWETTGIK
jgi:hypothetical protein